MEPKVDTRNWIIFAILAITVFVGSSLLQNYFFPPKHPEQAAGSSFVIPGILPTPGVPGIGAIAQEATNQWLASYLSSRNYRLPPALAKEGGKQAAPPPQATVQLKPQATAPRKEIWMGNEENFNLRVKLTSFGAGVESLILTQFQAASAMGLPEDRPMELLQEQYNRGAPSNRLYHYASKDDQFPVDTLGNLDWTVERSETDNDKNQHQVVFSADVPGADVRISKTYTLNAGDYHVGLEIKLQRKGQSKEPIQFRYQLAGGHGMPIEGEWYTSVFRNALTGLVGDKGAFQRDFQTSASIAVKQGGDQQLRQPNQRIQYTGTAIQYFASVIAVDNEQSNQDFLAWVRPTVERVVDPRRPFLDDITVRAVTMPIDLKPGESVVHKYLLYNGPVKVKLLGDATVGRRQVSPELINRYIGDLHLNTLTDYHMPNFMSELFASIGWTRLLITVTNFMHDIMSWLHSWIPNYGVCIIILTVLVRGLMHPISRKQARTSMRMQALAPEMKKLQEKFKEDPAAKQREMMALYRKHGVSPMGSCWVIFLQMPIFLGLYYSLQESIHFRLAHFLWIQNLAAPDMLFWWSEKIPLISDPANQIGFGSFLYLGPFFNLLPILAVGLMIVQQKFLMPPPTDEQAEMQQKMMKYMMIFMGVMFYKVAAGLCVYFIVSSLWGVIERQLLPKTKPPGTATEQVPAGSSGKGGNNRPRPKRPGPKAPGANGSMMDKVREMWAELLEQAKKK
jgi:YidC/Oxa1 family membrane protein insertase